MTRFTFANIGIATDRAVMLGATGIDVSLELEQARRVPLGRIGHYLCEEILKSFGLAIFIVHEKEPRMGLVHTTYF